MTIPDQDQWLRIEALAEELGAIPPAAAVDRLMELKAAGEPVSLVSFVGRWLSLPPPPAPFAAGDTVGRRFILLGKLGEGGMGVVWEATDTYLQRKVAIKMIHPFLVTPALRDRFVAEMRALGQLNDPGIVQIYDVGEEPRPAGCSVPFFVMEVVEGGVRLDLWAERHREDRERLLRVMVDVCTAMQHAHERSIVHRDLKPSNILVRPNGKPVILDFGVARLAGGDPGEPDAGFSGTPQYAAPEQHLGRDQDVRSGESVDVYAIGAILFEVLSGQRLFEFSPGNSILEMRRQIVAGTAAKLRDVLPDCPPELDEIVARTVRRDPLDRQYSMASLARALARVVAAHAEAPIAVPPWRPATGSTVPGSGWKLTQKLGEGSAGEVWAGEHDELVERRVFKFCDSEEKARTLKREMTLFRLVKERIGRNPHFIQLEEVSLEEPPWYLMMEWVEAQDLESWTASRPGGLASVSLDLIIEVIAQAAEALQAAHEAGILHRDIKPSNLLIQERSNAAGLHVFVSDFGIGQIVADDLLKGGTRLGFTRTLSDYRSATLSGTLLYLAPEVLEGHSATARSDIYSLGLVLWQLLIGNLRAALDPAEWRNRIADPLLREDVALCLAGSPEQRWSSAGALAASLRALPQRRLAETRRRAELDQIARAGFRRGVIRTTAIAAAIVGLMIALVAVAWVQRRQAREAHAQIALEQAANVLRFDQSAGRQERGLSLLKEGARLPAFRTTIRTVAAGLLALPDLKETKTSIPSLTAPTAVREGETARAISPHGNVVAVGRDVDGLQGAVDFLDPAGTKLRTLQRTEFPWIPIPEPGFLAFSPDGQSLAVAGPTTSLQVLIVEAAEAAVKAYVFTSDDLACLAWHPGSRVLATGDADGAVRLWDIRSGRIPKTEASANSDFSLPPALTAAAVDFPFATLEGWKGALAAIAFHPSGRWLAAVDAAGWLRIWSSFIPHDLPDITTQAATANDREIRGVGRPALLLEVKLGHSGPLRRLEFHGDELVLAYPGKEPLAFRITEGAAFRERWIAAGLRKLAWSADGATLCAITSTDAHWLSRDTLVPFSSQRGVNPKAVAPEAASAQWALPDGTRLVLRSPQGSGAQSTPSLSKTNAWAFIPAEVDQGTRFAMAPAGGRLAFYFGRRLQFSRHGKPESDTSVVVPAGAFQDLLWDSSGRLATIVYETSDGLRGESYQTEENRTLHVGTVHSKSEQLVSADDGVHLISRSVAHGLSRVHAITGEVRLLDASSAARQRAPMAVSPGGRWIAAVTDRTTIRLLDAGDGSHYADLVPPRTSDVEFLCWDPSGKWLASIADNGFVQLWSLEPWRQWLVREGVAE